MVRLLIIGFLFGAIAVLLGAFGAHGLEHYLNETRYSKTFHTGVNYRLADKLNALIFNGKLISEQEL